MKLWTIQPKLIHDKLMKDKCIYYSNKQHVDEDFIDGYEWLISEMEKRVGKKPFEDCYPVWAWYQYNSIKSAKPDLRRSAHLPEGTEGVRLTIEKPDNEVLLSDFDLWHNPLCYKGFIGNSEEETLTFYKELEDKGLGRVPFEDLPSEIKVKIQNSWEKIFDMDYDCEYHTYPKNLKSIQATFWQLKIVEVKKVEYFTAR